MEVNKGVSMPSRVAIVPEEMFGVTVYKVCVYGSCLHQFDSEGEATICAERLRCKLKERK